MEGKRIRGRFFFKRVRFEETRPRGPYSQKSLKVGVWMSLSPKTRLSFCQRGFHFFKLEHRKRWCPLPLWSCLNTYDLLCKVEVRGDRFYDDKSKKGLAREMKILHAVDKFGRKLKQQPEVFKHVKSSAANRKRR